MTLADLENEVLSTLQQTDLVNFGGTPLWSTATNAEFDQATVDHWINRAFIKVVRDVSDIDVCMYSATFTSVPNTNMYPLPPIIPSPPASVTNDNIAFDVASVGANNANTAVVARFPLPVSVLITGMSAVFQAGSAPLVNVVLGEAAELGVVPVSGAIATAGQSVFATDQSVGTVAGAVIPLPVPSGVIWPAGSELTLRVATGAAGVGGLKVVLTVTILASTTVLANPPVGEVRRVFYTPVGLGYTLEFEPKIRLLPWKEFQRYTASGYLNQFSYGTQPEICSVTPDRTELAFYPGTANLGDVIEVQYSPVPAANTFVPLLVNATDEPYILPDDFHELIPIYALYKLWPKARAVEAAEAYLAQYYKQLDYIRAMWKRRHGGDQQRFTDAAIDQAMSGPFGWP